MEVREGFPEEVSAEGPASNSGHRAAELGVGTIIDRPDGFPHCAQGNGSVEGVTWQGTWLLRQGTLISQLPAPHFTDGETEAQGCSGSGVLLSDLPHSSL